MLTRGPPIKRRRKAIRKGAKFKAHGDNPLKTYRRRFTDYQVTIRAQICRQQRLRDPTRAEISFAEILDGIGILYEREAIFLNGDRFVLIDFLVRSAKVAFEIDGSAHVGQENYDQGRDRWLLSAYKIRTARIRNREVFGEPDKVKALVLKELSF